MYSKYTKVVEQNLNLSDDKLFFKKSSDYREILEHVSFVQGIEYLNKIGEEFKYFYENNLSFLKSLCQENDKYGEPIKCNFTNFVECSPTNIRYIYHSLLILKYLQTLEKHQINIIEIGGGYGGLCLFLYKLSPFFKIKIKSYTIFDLEIVTLLQQKYLNLFEIKIQTGTLKKIKDLELKKESFLISNYAFSEISNNDRNEYQERIIKPYILHGFLVWNHIQPYQFIEKKLKIEEERPSTQGNQIINKFIYF